MYRLDLLGLDGSVYQTIGGFETWDDALDWANSHDYTFDSYYIFEDEPSSRKTNQFNSDMVKALSGILCDINPTEIASQIANDNLNQWCETIRAEILREVQK